MFGNKNITTKELLKSVRQIEIKTSRIVNSYFSGQYHSAFKGHGIEFDEVRKYLNANELALEPLKIFPEGIKAAKKVLAHKLTLLNCIDKAKLY